MLELARSRGYTIEETDVPITQALEVGMSSCVVVKGCRSFGPRAPYYDGPHVLCGRRMCPCHHDK